MDELTENKKELMSWVNRLEKVHEKYDLDEDFYKSLKKDIRKGDNRKIISDTQWLISHYVEKPHVQKRLCMHIYYQFEVFQFFNKLDENNKYNFVHWLYQQLRERHNQHIAENGFLYVETGKINHIWFLMEGTLEFVLCPKTKKEVIYHTLGQGSITGWEDLVYALPRRCTKNLND